MTRRRTLPGLVRDSRALVTCSLRIDTSAAAVLRNDPALYIPRFSGFRVRWSRMTTAAPALWNGLMCRWLNASTSDPAFGL